MDSGLRSRKRKQRPTDSDPFGGIFTRSRSQIYFHRHRSGYARSDSNRIRNLIKSRTSAIQSEATVDRIKGQVSVKDLRARRVFSPATVPDDDIGKVDLEADFDVHKKNEARDGDFRVSESVAVDLQASSENVVDCSSVREIDVMEAQVTVQMTPTIEESEQNKRLEEKDEMISVANEIVDTKESTSKSQSSVTSLRGRRKIFKSPSSFNYQRLLPYLRDSGNNDSVGFEIIDEALPKVMKSSNIAPNMVALKEEKNSPVSNSTKLADGLLNNTKSCVKQFSNSVNDGLISTVESSDVVQKSQEAVLNDTVEEFEQMTPPDYDINSKSKTGAQVHPKLKPVLKSCSRNKVLQTPTSFSHRRLLPFLMSVAGDYSSNQSLKLEKAIEQNQQPPTQSLSHQDEKSTTADETSNSPTSTLIPLDTPTSATKAITLVSNDNILDANGPDKKGSGSISQLEVVQGDALKSDSCIKLEQSPPKNNLKCVEEATSKATPLCIDQSYSEDHQISVKESPQQYLLPAPEVHGEILKYGILKRTPRGCRGICNCLNCTSFRLHAERSFEFSKNQMHDAEEVALELINDLTCLRNILETTNSSNSVDTVKEKQVKEACAKALYKEQVARARLAQLNEDLSIHCRSMNLLRPKVTFANKIEEKSYFKK